MNTPETSEPVDFFISYNHADCGWATGIANWLKEQHYTTVQQASAALAELNPIRKSIERQLNEIDLLPQKILSEAFGGEPAAEKGA